MGEIVTMWLPNYCGNTTPYQAFWNDDIMVNTAIPDITECFRNTLIVPLTHGILIPICLIYCVYLYAKDTVCEDGPRGWVYKSKMILLMLLLIFWLAIFGLSSYHFTEGQTESTISVLVANFLRILSTFAVILTTFIEYKKGIHTSGTLFVTYSLVLVAESAALWSCVSRWNMEDKMTSLDNASSILSFILTFLTWLCIIKVDQSVFQYTLDLDKKFDYYQLHNEKTPLLQAGKQLKNRTKDPKSAPPNPSPQLRASFLSDMFNIWYFPFVIKCCRKMIEFKDIYDLEPGTQSSSLIPGFDHYWSQGGKKPSLAKVICKFAWKELVLALFMRLVTVTILLMQPFILGRLLEYIDSGDPHVWKGVLLSFFMMCCNIIAGVLVMKSIYRFQKTGMMVKSTLTVAIFRKTLKLSNEARLSTTVGQIVNFISVDAQRIQDSILYIQPIVTVPAFLVLICVCLWQSLGVISLVTPVIVVCIMIPFNGFVAGRNIQKLQIKQMVHKDKRLRLLSEMLGGAKILKLYAWEDGFLKKLTSTRNTELSFLAKSNIIFAVSSVVWNAITNIIILFTYMIYILISTVNILTPDLAFVTSSFVQLMQTPAMFFTAGISFMGQAMAAIDRINDYLLLEENHPENDKTDIKPFPIYIAGGYFTWLADGPPVLRNLNLSVKKGSLVAVVGHVGSGKSSIISTVLRETTKQKGTIHVDGSTAYVPQQPWIQNRTLKDNILMNQTYNSRLYNRVLDTCALRTDLDILVDGDQTEIGQKGINLSGGQKQRVSLARAVYQNKDIYLLDDPLSAVDSHVAKHLFEQVIGPTGVLKNKTRILVSNNVTCLPEVDYILMLEEGQVIERGTFAQLMQTNGSFASFVKGFVTDRNGENGAKEEIRDFMGLSDEFAPTQRGVLARNLSRRSSRSNATSRFTEESRLPRHVLVQEEVAEHGAIKIANLKVLFSNIPAGLAVGIIVFYSLYLITLVLGNIQLSVWTSKSLGLGQTGYVNISYFDQYDTDIVGDVAHEQRIQLAIYFAIIVGQVIVNMLASICLAIGLLYASRFLHASLLSRVFHAPMAFFDTTPIGRILNRLSRDIDILDFNIPAQLRVCTMYSVPMIAVLISIAYTNVIFLAVLVPLLAVFGTFMYMNITAIRQLRRIESIRLSPLLVHFDDAVSGISSIKAYELQDWFIESCDRLTDESQRAVALGWVTRRWVGVALQCMAGVLVLCTTLLAVFTRTTGSSGNAGMSISVSLQAYTILTNFVNTSTELNSYLVALERIKEYSEIDQEIPFYGEQRHVSSAWPDEGRVHYRGYAARYRPGLDLALQKLELDVKPGQKVAVVGRTGAGKSSLSLALFRLFNSAEGGIFIDGVNIANIELNQLRSRLTIIPQDPVVFSGTLRLNLDPYSEYNDRQIWTSLDQSHLGSFVRAQAAGLQYDCGDGGEALSLGQRQLVCLARALLRRSRVLILDEATAAVDPETDELIQATIRQAFWKCTIITIAHRLTTILDYDRVGVMDSGKMVEYDSPETLLANPFTVFHGMALAAGIVDQEQEGSQQQNNLQSTQL